MNDAPFEAHALAVARCRDTMMPRGDARCPLHAEAQGTHGGSTRFVSTRVRREG
jgi:hypothetical protein